MRKTATNLSKMCCQRNILQRELAEQSNLPVRYVQDLCNGSKKINTISASAVCAMAAALNCNVTDILEYEINDKDEKIVKNGDRTLIIEKNRSFRRMLTYEQMIKESRWNQ